MSDDKLHELLKWREDALCTCGAAHGSLEGHTNWCDYISPQTDSDDDYVPALQRVRQIAMQSEIAPLSMCEIVKRVDMALGEESQLPDWMTAPQEPDLSDLLSVATDDEADAIQAVADRLGRK